MAVLIADDKMNELLQRFEQTGLANDAVAAVRKQALDTFIQLGYPTTRNEDWKYTNLAPVVKENYLPYVSDNTPTYNGSFGHLDIQANHLVFIDGVFAEQYSSILDKQAGVVIGSLAKALQDGNQYAIDNYGRHLNEKEALNNLNAAFARDGAFIYVPKGVTLEYPVALFFTFSDTSSKTLQSVRNVIVAEINSQVEVVECYQYGNRPTFVNTTTVTVINDDARVRYNKVQVNAAGHTHVATLHADMGRQAHFMANTFDFSGRVIRNNVTVNMNGEYGEVHLNGLYALDNSDHSDNHIVVNHNVPNCLSYQLYKGLLDGKSDGAFNGRIYVKKDAQKTNAFQSNKNILLSEDANVNSKPQLEIFADDVKCSHGSTTGQIDKKALFYLRSRGLDKEQAKAMLNIAFAGEIIRKVTIEPLKNWLFDTLATQLHTEEEISTHG